MKSFDTLVLSGASTSGICFLGKLFNMSIVENPFENVTNFAGVSIGSVISLLMLIGYSPQEIAHRLYIATIWPNFANFFQIFVGKGLYKFDLFKEELSKMIREKFQNQLPTFAQLSRNFLCCSYNMSKRELCYFDTKRTPQMCVLTALLCSCAIPFIFEPFYYNDELYIDGGIVNNFPIVECTKIFECKEICGMLCCKNNNSINSLRKEWSIFSDLLPILFCANSYFTTSQIEQVRQQQQHMNLVLFLIKSDIQFFNLNLNAERIAHMFTSGMFQ